MNYMQLMVSAFKTEDTKKLYLKFIIMWLNKSICSDMVYEERYTCKPSSMLVGQQQYKSMANANRMWDIIHVEFQNCWFLSTWHHKGEFQGEHTHLHTQPPTVIIIISNCLISNILPIHIRYLNKCLFKMWSVFSKELNCLSLHLLTHNKYNWIH